jgi:tetratricopeptide (TPR) repeat protein
MLHVSQGQYEKALPVFEEALAMRRAALPRGHPDLVASLIDLAMLHKSRGDDDKMWQLYEEAMDMKRGA